MADSKAPVKPMWQSIAEYADVAFRDLKDLSGQNAQVFDELFYDREDPFTLFRTIMDDARHTAVNVLIVGDAGVGKSNFIHKLVRQADVLNAMCLHPIIVDYRDQVPANATGCLMHVIEEMTKYFDVIGCPIHTLRDTTDANITVNFKKCLQHLENLPIKGAPKKHLLVILDDFDYAEEEWFPLLDFFLPLATSRRASVIFTVRPLLLAEVEEYDDRFTNYYVRNCHRIPLAPLDVARVISYRLALVLHAQEADGLYGRIRDRVTRNSTGLRSVLSGLGITDVAQLPAFEYPFTERHNMFMRRITNGNMREVFDIAIDTLIFMFDARNRLETRKEEGTVRRVMGREGVMKLFLDDGTPPRGPAYDHKRTQYRIENLHGRLSTSGNSLWFNVLEAVKLRQVTDDTFFDMLATYGHKSRDVEAALQQLSSKTKRLICPVRLRPRSSSSLQHDVPEYHITEKGDYYLQICEWDEYIARCGSYGRSILQEARQ